MPDTALQELARDASSRKRFLKMAGGAGGAGALSILIAACGGSDKKTSSTATSASTATGTADAAMTGDLKIVNYALTLEYLEAQFYDEVAKSGLFHGTTLAMLKRFGAEEHAHVAALKGVATKLGTPAAKPTGKFPLHSAKQVSKLAATVENLGASAYLGQAGTSRARRSLRQRSRSTPSRRATPSTLNSLLKMTPTPDGAFARPMTMAQVLKARSSPSSRRPDGLRSRPNSPEGIF